ncbi:MAG: FliH/SctL family protein [bacterium]|nr:FliH/SctL family protein [bacterium]
MNKIYKSSYLPPDGPKVIIDQEAIASTGGHTVLETLDNRIRQAQKRLLKLNAEIERKKEEAQTLKETIVQEANKKAEKVLEEAKWKGEKEIERIKRQAEEEGRKKGEEEGFRQGRQTVQKLLNKLEDIITEAKVKRNEIIRSSEADIMCLAILIAEKIIGSEISTNREVVLNNVKKALKKITGKEEIVIRVNIDDLELVKGHKSEFLNQVRTLRKIDFEEDPSIERGGCRILTDFGSVDARLSTQLDEIRKSLLNVAEQVKIEPEI